MSARTDRAPDWLPAAEALERILAAVAPLSAERLVLHEALGRALAEEVRSPIDQPPWNNSAMDGFAVRAVDVAGATREAPARLELIGDVPAGGFPLRPVAPGQAIRVNTGAPIPEGADSVVRLEHTDRWRGQSGGVSVRAEQPEPRADAGTDSAARDAAPDADALPLLVYDDADALRNVRSRGEDVRVGDLVLEPGHVLRPAEIGVLAVVGRDTVAVHRAPRVAILSNGNELVDLDGFDEVLQGRRIVNSNAHALAAAVRAAGCTPVMLGIARDDIDSLRERLARALDADALITTAGASVGEHDLVKDALDELGFELDFWRVRFQPGSPFAFGRLGRTAVFSLAGNPVSAMVTYEVLVRPALRRMLGRTQVYPPTIRVRVAERIPTRAGLTRFLRVRLEPHENGEWAARLTGPQGSGILTSMSRADALLIVPEALADVAEGTLLRALPLPAPDAGSRALEL